MIKIDEEILCDYCVDVFGEGYDSWKNKCEGICCEGATERYLDDHAITDDSQEQKSFGKLNIGDNIYIIKDDCIIPRIEVVKINSLSQMNDGYFTIHYESTSLYINNTDSKEQKLHFLYKKDAQNKLKEICTNRIIQLSEVIGSLKEK